MIYPIAHQRMMQWSNKEDCTRGIPTVWQDNAVKNIAYFDAHPEKVIGSVHKMPYYEGKAVIFVGRGQSLEKAIDMFKDVDDRFIIVCTNSSIRYLLDHGVIPTYMMLIDGEKGNWTFDNLPEQAKDVTAIFAPGAYHEEVIKWPGKIMVTPYGLKHGQIQKQIRKRWGKSIPAGGNALNGGIAIFLMNTAVKIYVFVGNNLSFKEGGRFYFDQDTERDDKAYFVMHDIYGEECYTDMPMYQYKAWLEQAASQFFPDCYFVNCSEGILGVDVDGSIMNVFNHMPLNMAIGQIKEAMEFEDQPLIDRYKGFYQRIYDNGMYDPHTGVHAWTSIIQHFEENKFKVGRAMDVGCGPGHGLKLARDKGINVWGTDIVDNTKMWKENGIEEYCRQAPAHDIPYPDNSFDFVYCGDVLEHIPEEYLEPSLNEMFRICKGNFIFVIATGLEELPAKALVYTHVSIKQMPEWLAMMEKIGYTITHAAHDEGSRHCTIQATNMGAK
jgi:SAM-dependent methyltransferase